MASTEGLVPITRNFLASYYDKYPFPPLSDDVSRLSSDLHSTALHLLKDSPSPTAPALTSLARQAASPPPHKIDENMWKNREHIEEILYLLQQSTPEDAQLAILLPNLIHQLQHTLTVLESFQSKNSQRIFDIVMTYMPQDFRGTLIRQQRERSERNKLAEVDALVNSGGSIGDRYALLWKQQMERRRQLAQLGSATGVYRTLVKYLVGVPQVLLDFIRQINDDEGPMEEQRQRYGPPLYSLTTMVLFIRLFISVSWWQYDSRKLERRHVAVLEQAINVYSSEFERFIKCISEVFVNSPFFISADVAGTFEAKENDDYKETTIPAGKYFERGLQRNYERTYLLDVPDFLSVALVPLSVESVNSYIAWDFSLSQGKMNMDIGFSVEYTYPNGERSLILPYRRYESDQGNFCTCMAGNYKLIWDNSYSTFFKKALRYKVDCIPPEPVVDALQTATAVLE